MYVSFGKKDSEMEALSCFKEENLRMFTQK